MFEDWPKCNLSSSELMIMYLIFDRKEQELSESSGNNENLLAQIESLKKKIRELEVKIRISISWKAQTLIFGIQNCFFFFCPVAAGQLSPCGHLAITDTPILRTAAKSSAKINNRRLTEINSRYYGLSLLRTLTRGPKGVRNKGS